MTGTRVLTSLVLSGLLLIAAPVCAQWQDPALADAEPMPRASDTLLLDAVALEGGRLLAVGERGHVLWSDDEGGSWQQAQVPTRATLTTVAAHGSTAIAAGHDGVIVRSTDDGVTWQRVREDVFNPDAAFDPTAGVPILDLVFLDAERVLAIGAYSLILASRDAGASWQAWSLFMGNDSDEDAEVGEAETGEEMTGLDVDDERSDPLLFDQSELMLDDEEDPHLNALARLADGRLFIVAERGSAFLSDDDGASWRRLSLPYDGSMFGVLALDETSLLTYGLRGNAQLSRDRGETWQLLDTGTELSLLGGAVDASGVVLSGANGLLLRADETLREFNARTLPEAGVLSALLATVNGRLLVLGENGMQRVDAAGGQQ